MSKRKSDAVVNSNHPRSPPKKRCLRDLRSFWPPKASPAELQDKRTTNSSTSAERNKRDPRLIRVLDKIVVERPSSAFRSQYVDFSIVLPPPQDVAVTTTSRGRRIQRMSFVTESDASDDDDIPTRNRRSKLRCKTSPDDDGSDFDPDGILDAESSADDVGSAAASSEGEESTFESDGEDSQDSLSQDRRQPTKTAHRGAKPPPTSSTSTIRKKTTKHRMISLTKNSQRALDTSLRPLSNIKDIFLDMTSNALEKGLRQALPQWSGRIFRVATMCSGTESPLLALQMIQEVLCNLGEHSFNVVHLFSAEIVPYKQAYIERNFSVPVIFRDITELTKAKNRSHKATTAYGAEVDVPGDLHLLVAGTACVDYSMLNNKQKSMEDNGESGDTFRAVLSYARNWRPKMLILENVFTAPWDDMLKSYEDEDYAVAGVLLDTKAYYLPQTRQRGYMLCLDNRACKSPEAAAKAVRQWTDMMSALKRPASSPAADFMLSSNDPAVLRARALLARRSLLDSGGREVDWAKCAIRHIQYRREEQIGNARPYTSWQESGSLSVPDYADHDWFRQQVERVWDMLDCSFLRKALPKAGNYDIQFKSRIINVSQNIDRNPDSTPAGIAPCLTPSGIFFVTNRGATLSPDETIALQGLPLDRISFTTETPKQIQDLAGNAMSSTVVGAAILSAITATASKLSFDQEPDLQNIDLAVDKQTIVAFRPDAFHAENISNSPQNIDLVKLIQDAQSSCQRCTCEGPFDVAPKAIQTCIDCGHSSCLACGGKPAHNYSPKHIQRRDRMEPSVFKQRWESLLPSHLSLQCGPTLLADLRSKKGPLCSRYTAAVEAAFEGVFRSDGLRRSRNWSATWRSHNARLNMIVKAEVFEWQLFACPDANLAVGDELRRNLTKPIAMGRSNATSLIDVKWSIRFPLNRNAELSLSGKGSQTASWLARLNIPAYRDEVVWDEIEIRMGDSQLEHIDGNYVYLPKCGTASESLYKRMGSPSDEPRFLMLDPDPIGDADNDRCIITDDSGRLSKHERHVLMQFPPKWRPWLFMKKSDVVTVSLDHGWLDAGPAHIELHTVDANIKLTTPDLGSWRPTKDSQDCWTGVEILTMEVPSTLITGALVLTDAVSFADIRWLFCLVNPHLDLNKETPLLIPTAQLSCSSCMPTPAPLRWKRSADMKSLKPYEDPGEATRFEKNLKARPSAIELQRQTEPGYLKLSIALNLITLAHRVFGKLQGLAQGIAGRDDPVIHWKIDTSYSENSTLELPEFTLKNNDEDVSDNLQVSLEIDLWTMQQKSLAWMLRQETRGGVEYTIEEVEELIVPGADWRVEVTARHKTSVRGGIQASHPGFGKTICTLALVSTDFANKSRSQIINSFSRNAASSPAQGIDLAATLIIAPKHLVVQWTQEIEKVLGKHFAKSIITIAVTADLNKHNIENFSRATIIVLNQDVLTSDQYIRRLAAFAAVPEPSVVRGRQYKTWLQFVNKEIPEHVQRLQTLGREGLKDLKKHLKAKYMEHMKDANFEATIPSKRRTGKAYADRKPDSGIDSDMANKSRLPTLEDKDLLFIDKCLFEMFNFNRIVVDEFTYLNPKEAVAIENLKADKRWALSATAKLDDPFDIAKMASLIGVRLRVGENAPGALSQKNTKAILEERTDFEQFQTFRTAPSVAVTKRTYELAQYFLDKFVRQNILEFEARPYADHLVPVQLAVTHRLVYTELSQHLNGADMRVIKGRKAASEDRDRDLQIMENLQGVESAEEALARLSAIFEYRGDKASTGTISLKDLISIRECQAEAAKQRLSTAVGEITVMAVGCDASALKSWRDDILEARSLGDEAATETVRMVFRDAEKNTGKAQATRKPSEKQQQQLKDKLSSLNVLAKQYMASLRSIRFAKNAQRLLSISQQPKSAGLCDCQGCDGSVETVMSISSLCGHIVCDQCWLTLQTRTGLCNAVGCNAPIHKYNLLRSDKLRQAQPDSDIGTLTGAKVKSVVDLLKKIQGVKEQAVLFVQYEYQIGVMEDACRSESIGCIAVRDNARAAKLITEFQTDTSPGRKTAIILNASNSSAAGVNLTNANNMLFMSPLLTDTQYSYEAALAQAIGRIRRPGQEKDIHVYRLAALDTIDVDILEHRERRATELSEDQAPAAAMQSTRATSPRTQTSEKKKPERTQMIRDRDGFMRLLPRSWLVGDQTEFGNGIEGRFRVAGYEDFSSLVKFSKAYSEDN